MDNAHDDPCTQSCSPVTCLLFNNNNNNIILVITAGPLEREPNKSQLLPKIACRCNGILSAVVTRHRYNGYIKTPTLSDRGR